MNPNFNLFLLTALFNLRKLHSQVVIQRLIK